MPAAFESADSLSTRAQRGAVSLTSLSLILLVLSAVGGVINYRVRNETIDVGGLVSLACFTGALFVMLTLAARRPEREWYLGRAAAESIKTLCWKYSVSGAPFNADMSDPDGLLVRRIGGTIRGTQLSWVPPTRTDEITQTMRNLRALPLQQRIEAYDTGRIGEQLDWYLSKARSNKSRGNLWSGLTALATLMGVLVGLCRAFTIVQADVLGIFAAAAAAASSWGQFRQHMTLATAYSVASLELGLVRANLRKVATEDQWARLVSDSEDAISREHTLWVARRGGIEL